MLENSIPPIQATCRISFKANLIAIIFPALLLFGACDKLTTSDLQVEALPVVKVSLPSIPTIPPPPHPVTYENGSYSIYGARAKLRMTIDTSIQISAYIVKIYEAEPCDKTDGKCTALIPHLWLADKADETDNSKLLLLVGYAETQKQIDEAKRSRRQKVAEGETPTPTDFKLGRKINVKGRFSRVAGSGFTHSEGLLEYAGHETIAE